jgi:hypothetical protein
MFDINFFYIYFLFLWSGFFFFFFFFLFRESLVMVFDLTLSKIFKMIFDKFSIIVG